MTCSLPRRCTPWGYLGRPSLGYSERRDGGPDVWIARDATIFSGVTIAAGAVVGARSFVTRDVEPYAIVAGNPATQIAVRFDPEVSGGSWSSAGGTGLTSRSEQPCRYCNPTT